MIDPISWAHTWPYILAAFAAAYLLGPIPFGLVLTKSGWRRGKSAPAISGRRTCCGPATRSWPPPHSCWTGPRARLPSLPISTDRISLSSRRRRAARTSVSVWLKFRGGGRRDRAWHSSGAVSAGRWARMRHLAAGSRSVSVFVPVRSAGHRGGPVIHVVARRSAVHGVRRRDGDTGLDTSPSEHPTPDTRRRIKDRFFPQGINGRSTFTVGAWKITPPSFLIRNRLTGCAWSARRR